MGLANRYKPCGSIEKDDLSFYYPECHNVMAVTQNMSQEAGKKQLEKSYDECFSR